MLGLTECSLSNRFSSAAFFFLPSLIDGALSIRASHSLNHRLSLRGSPNPDP